VTEGGAIPMHYDSMIAKLVVHGRDRAEAVARMRDALDGFALRGVQSNIAFQAAVLGHARFAAGDFDTGFVADQFPYGFRAADVPHAEPDFLVVLAAAVHQRLQAQPAAQTPYVVLLHGEAGQWQHRPLRLCADGDALQIELDGCHHRVQTAWRPGALRVTGEFNGQAFTAQVDRVRVRLRLRLTHRGRRVEALVLTPRAAELWTLMPHKAPPDTSKLLLAPMPGLLAQVAVLPGQLVRAGEKLAVVEAMKMENILTALQDATVAEILAEAGTGLAVDRPILRFA